MLHDSHKFSTEHLSYNLLVCHFDLKFTHLIQKCVTQIRLTIAQLRQNSRKFCRRHRERSFKVAVQMAFGDCI